MDMKPSRFTEEQIIEILREQEAEAKRADHEVSNATFYKWKAKFGEFRMPSDYVRSRTRTRAEEAGGAFPNRTFWGVTCANGRRSRGGTGEWNGTVLLPQSDKSARTACILPNSDGSSAIVNRPETGADSRPQCRHGCHLIRAIRFPECMKNSADGRLLPPNQVLLSRCRFASLAEVQQTSPRSGTVRRIERRLCLVRGSSPYQ
jgi:hypothetical protein